MSFLGALDSYFYWLYLSPDFPCSKVNLGLSEFFHFA